jgi:hypothetical protein
MSFTSGISKRSDDSLLNHLKRLLETHGRLDQSIIMADQEGPPLWVYVKHFGKLGRAYERIGYVSPYDKSERDKSTDLKRAIFRNLAEFLRDKGYRCVWNSYRRHLLIEDSLSLGILIGKYKPTPHYQRHRWVVHTARIAVTELTIVMRLDFQNQKSLDYLLLPREMVQSTLMCLTENLRPELRAYRYATLRRLVQGLLLQLAIQKSSRDSPEVVG